MLIAAGVGLCLSARAIGAGQDSAEETRRAANIPDSAWAKIKETIAQDNAQTVTCHSIKNLRQKMAVEFQEGRLAVTPTETDKGSPWKLNLSLKSFGYGTEQLPLEFESVSAAERKLECAYGVKGEAKGKPVVSEWYVNRMEGLEQGFTLFRQPVQTVATSPVVRVTLAVETDLTPEIAPERTGIRFTRAGKTILNYDHLKVTDAEGKTLPSFMDMIEVQGQSAQLVLAFNATDAVYPITVDPILYAEEAIFTNPTGLPGGFFGGAIDMTANTLVVGACTESNPGYGSWGKVYIYYLGANNQWTLVKTINAQDQEIRYFGDSVAIDGDTLVVGAPTWSTEVGAVYVYKRNQGGADQWGQVQRILASPHGYAEFFGEAVDVSGTRLLTTDWQYHAYVYKADASGVWQLEKIIEKPDFGFGSIDNCFGDNLSIDGDRCVISSPENYAACIYSRNNGGENNWGVDKILRTGGAGVDLKGDILAAVSRASWYDPVNNPAKVTLHYRNSGGADNWGAVKSRPLPLGGIVYDSFQTGSCRLSGDRLAVQDGLTNVKIFRRDMFGSDQWGLLDEVSPSQSLQSGEIFGHSLAMNGSTLLVGVPNYDATTVEKVYQFDSTFTSWTCTKKIMNPENQNGARFGTSVDVWGNTLVVGAYLQTVSGMAAAGKVYVFERDLPTENNWGLSKTITASDAAANNYYGYSVSIELDTLIVGTYGPMKAYVYYRNQNGPNLWGEVKKLTAANERFGASVDIDVDTLVVGAPGKTSPGIAGKVYVFMRNQGSANNWGLSKEISTRTQYSNSDSFGAVVRIDGDYIIVGAPDYYYGDGHAYIFERNLNGSNQWGERKRLNPATGGTQYYGYGVSIMKDLAIVGAPYRNTGLLYQGAVEVFRRDQGGANSWNLVTTLMNSDPVSQQIFGRSTSIDEDSMLLVIGAPGSGDEYSTNGGGAAYIYENSGSDAWVCTKKLVDAAGAEDDRFGMSVSVNCATVAVGAMLDDQPGGANTGSVSLFEPIPLD